MSNAIKDFPLIDCICKLAIYNYLPTIFCGAPRALCQGGISPHAARRSGRLREVTIVSHFVRCRFATESCCHMATRFAESCSFHQIKYGQYSKDFRLASDFIEYKQVTCQRKDYCESLETASLSWPHGLPFDLINHYIFCNELEDVLQNIVI